MDDVGREVTRSSRCGQVRIAECEHVSRIRAFEELQRVQQVPIALFEALT